MTLVSTVGGAGGPLYGTLFLQLGTAAAGKEVIERRTGPRRSRPRSRAFARGKAELEDKTMVDALSRRAMPSRRRSMMGPRSPTRSGGRRQRPRRV